MPSVTCLFSGRFRATFPLLAALALGILLTSARTEELRAYGGWEVCACKRHFIRSMPLDPDADHVGNGRKYAPDREIDVAHVKLELDPDFDARSLAGIATLTFSPIAKPLTELRLDAVDLRVEDITSTAEIETWTVGNREITISFVEPIPAGAETRVTVTYDAEPRENGWYFRTEAMGYPEGDDHFWTQGEPEKHRHWFPGYDYPNERFTSEVICRVPKGMTVLSNGRLVEEREEGENIVFHWHQEEEHVNYLISVVGGYFDRLDGEYGDLPLAFLTPPSEFAVAANSFRDTADILRFLEGEIGVEFPWAKYYNVCVTDFVAGGMENTSVTTLTTGTLFSEETENLRTTRHLDAHEVTHQWFGDLLTCKDWSHLWLNEGFATYYTHLYEEDFADTDTMRYRLLRDADGILSNQDEKPIVYREYSDPFEQFDYRAYPKGSWVLHMLRSQLGPELFRECVKTYVEKHRNRSVVTHDLIEVFEEVSGRSFDEFFDQWVYHGGEPVLKIGYAWDQKRKQVKLSIAQTQKLSERVLLFDFPLPIRITDEKGEVHDFTVRVHEASEDFFFSLPEKPKIVRIDPDLTVLAKVEFTPPNPLLFAQLANPDDMLGRLFAVRALGGKKDARSREAMAKVLQEDPFYGVRIEAAKALAKTHTPEALAILSESVDQDDARVRQEVVRSLGKFYRESALARLKEIAAAEKNPDIVATALGSLGKFPKDAARPALVAALDRESYRHRISSAAIGALKQQADPEVVPVVKAHLEAEEDRFPSRDFGRALGSLAALARYQDRDEREETRQFIAGFLEHPKAFIRRDAIHALGALEDPRSLAALQSFVAAADQESLEYRAAESAIEKLNGEKKQADEVRDLRKELLDLQKEFGALKKKLETEEKQEEAAEADQ